MKILYMGNNYVGCKVLEWLKYKNENIVGMIIHSPEKQKCTQEMIQISCLPPDRIFFGSQLNDLAIQQKISSLSPDVGLSIFFDYIIPPAVFQHIENGVINLHPALLPYNRGQYPNVWSIVERTPSGVTMHYIDEKLDSGDIVSQQNVEITAIDTGQTLYKKLEATSIELFTKTWPLIKNGNVPRSPQRITEGTYHRTGDVEKIDRINLDQQYCARYLIDVLRARTFPPYKGAFFEKDGKRIYLRLHLEYENET